MAATPPSHAQESQPPPAATNSSQLPSLETRSLQSLTGNSTLTQANSTHTLCPAAHISPTRTLAHEPIHLHTPVTPINVSYLHDALCKHPDPAFASFVIHSLSYGFDVGFAGPRTSRVSRNLKSAIEHPDIVDAAIGREIAAGRMAGPYQEPPFPLTQVSGLGVVPKKSRSVQKWRLIMHLSAPQGHSVNDGIPVDKFSVQYCSVDDGVNIARSLGRGCHLWKVDLQDAFRIWPVRKEDWELLCLFWRGQYYVDKCLPFGLRSSPSLFNKVADALQWVMSHNYDVAPVIHYLDDYLGGATDSIGAQHQLDRALVACHDLGFPVNPKKVEGPKTTLTFLGVMLDTERFEIRLPSDKLEDLLIALKAWQHTRPTARKSELLSLIGHLSFACKAVPAGRMFLRRLIDLSTTVPNPNDYIRITEDAKADIQWWLDFLPAWNGVAFFLEPTWSAAADMDLYTDASRAIGYGAFFAGRWLQHRWQRHQSQRSIAWMELFAIVAAASTWAPQLHLKRIRFHCDNRSVCDIWLRSRTKCPDLMALVRTLFAIAARHNFHVIVSHIPGTDNAIADSLSRFQMARFRRLAPTADDTPSPVPESTYSL